MDENLIPLLEKAKTCGVQAITFSYAFYRNKFKRKLFTIPFLRDSLTAMNEKQPIASGKGFSLPLSEKRKRLIHMADIASTIGFEVISTCACKNQIGLSPTEIHIRPESHFHDKWF